ncbi:unnamed protein product [Euphydryas editha]|uniref:Uncharacterized protein n=1 Tax=Euphydryas editha TaxID=104508 RepID=A0AAU9UDT8_EUPED|nr:unnamed protein product [Euphydryas editha]
MSSADTATNQLRLVNPSNVEMVKAAIIDRVAKTNFEATAALVKLMAYEAINPVAVIKKKMSQKAEVWNKSERTDSWNLIVDNLTFDLTDKAGLANDVLFLITLFHTRGNNLRKILASIDRTVKSPLLIKMQIYGIKNDTDEDSTRRKRSEKVDMNSRDITLSRIAALFPHIGLSIVRKSQVRG